MQMGQVFELFFIIKVLSLGERTGVMVVCMRAGSNATSDIFWQLNCKGGLINYFYILSR